VGGGGGGGSSSIGGQPFELSQLSCVQCVFSVCTDFVRFLIALPILVTRPSVVGEYLT